MALSAFAPALTLPSETPITPHRSSAEDRIKYSYGMLICSTNPNLQNMQNGKVSEAWLHIFVRTNFEQLKLIDFNVDQ